MPFLNKEAISEYIRTECKRQLRLYLSPDNARYRAERLDQGMPDPQDPRPGLFQVRTAGDTWQAAKLHDLTETFGSDRVIGNRYVHSSGQIRYHPTPLADALLQVSANHFLIEMAYEVGQTFERALAIEQYREKYTLAYATVRPDIIEVLPPRQLGHRVMPSGDVERLPAGDARLQLRVIDIKLTAEPSPSYFAEVTYYMMTLSGWLIDQGLDDRFIVATEGAIWPGSHEASRLTLTHREIISKGEVPTTEQLCDVLKDDLEIVPFDVFAFRLRKILQRDLPDVLETPWRELDWHVDTSCSGCEYLGHQWFNAELQNKAHPDHCLPLAEREDHLSRVAFISRGVRTVLAGNDVDRVSALARRGAADPVFNEHQMLRAGRTVLAARAVSLGDGSSGIAPMSGTSAVMPKWADLRISLSVDFDIGSAITFAFGLKAYWREPQPYGADRTAPPQERNWGPICRVVDLRDLGAEQRELLAFLDRINSILNEAHSINRDTTVQFYIWDTLQYEHLARIIGRHLEAILSDHSLQRLAWLFPPEELLPNPRMSTRLSPITIVQDVVRSLLATPVTHYYSLLRTARVYQEPNLPAHMSEFKIHPHFEDILSDMIPSERAHEIWTRSTSPRHWQEQMRTLDETVKKRLRALETITKRLESDLRPNLDKTAPKINIGPPDAANRLSVDSQLWYAFSKLNNALAELEVHQTRAMPPHEREAKFQAARLTERLTGEVEQRALEQLEIEARPGRRVYRVRTFSREVKVREGEFKFAIAPERLPGFLDKSLAAVKRDAGMEVSEQDRNIRMEKVMKVTVAGIDRDNLLIAIDSNNRWPHILDQLEACQVIDLSRNAVLDPIHEDYFTRKLLAALQAIGNPDAAKSNPLVQQATGQMGRRGARRSAHTPPADFLWDGKGMYETRIERSLDRVKEMLVSKNLDLNLKQWDAWTQSLSRRLQLIWGPPGTGKSRTAVAIVLGAALEANLKGEPIRILICASTYTAMDNVLLPIYKHIAEHFSDLNFQVRRIRSYLKPQDPNIPAELDLVLNKANPTEQVLELRERLRNRHGIQIVGAPPEQVHNLLVMDGQSAQQELFDLILIDEASQMDVAHAVLPLCSLASSGAVVLAGDPKQLPPIHQAEPPVGLNAMVGSVYTFAEQVHNVPPVMLDQNYRSNSTIVEFLENSGYEDALTSYSPDLRLNLLSLPDNSKPEGWPSDLCWTPEWSALLNPEQPAACFIYPDGRSSQWNLFEAEAIASLIYLLHGRMASKLLGERDYKTGQVIDLGAGDAYTPDKFWEKAIGVVTPHRAQQGLITARLQQIFKDTDVRPSAIRNAVDTVERFQGQQRDVILASFALGDPDSIREEDEFLMSLNRFNVMASRPRAKLIIFASEEIIDHLSGDADVLRESRLLKLFVNSFCRSSKEMSLPCFEKGQERQVKGVFKFR